MKISLVKEIWMLNNTIKVHLIKEALEISQGHAHWTGG